MSIKTHKILILTLLLIAGLTAKAQLYSNDFENQYTWYPPWFNLYIAADSSRVQNNYVCVCDSIHEYGLGFATEVGTQHPHKNINIQYEFLFKADSKVPTAEIVFSIDNSTGNRYWYSYPLATFVSGTSDWSKMSLNLDFPFDYIGDGKISTYIWNKGKENLWFDNAVITVTPWSMPSFLPDIPIDSIVAYPIGVLTEYVLGSDTIREFQPFGGTENEKRKTENDLLTTILTIDTSHLSTLSSQLSALSFQLSTTFHRDCKLLRQALVVPFTDSTLTIYRKNMAIDTAQFQSEYYLDREGFKIGKGEHTIISYHQTGISSTQFDAENRIAYFNLDYWRDHPMIHYPLSDTLKDHFENVSYRQVYEGMQWQHHIQLYAGADVPNLPRIMSIPYGYESGIIFTEHADWTVIRTHRAVLFGSEKITKASEATGGFVHYGIPVTKSVFYNNPDHVTNENISQGGFTEPQATIKTDKEFKELLEQLQEIGFDICLHTPDQYTTTPRNLRKALRYMRKHFQSTTWIDHGYNNGPEKNREDMVCDGLNPQSDLYAASLWQDNGIKYLWNAYYEENRMEQWHFDNNLMQPYPGFGDALPNRQITMLTENGERKTENFPLSVLRFPFYTWCTPSTLEAVTDNEWDFYFSDQRLQRLVDNHDVHIAHIYPAWVWPGRTFWTYDADSTIVALPGMNRAFERIATLRDEHKMLPMTVKTYLDYYTRLLNVTYEIIDTAHVRLHNSGDEIKGFTMLCSAPVRLDDDRPFETRKSGDSYYIWFDLGPDDQVMVTISN